MADKQFRSKLFQAQPNQLFLDERVSKIDLPAPMEMKTEALDDESLAILMEEESEESEEQGVLQIFVGSAASEVKPEDTWNIQDEDDFDMDSEDDSDEFEAGGTLQITPIAVKNAVVRPNRTSTPKANITQRASKPNGENELDEWEEIDWDDVTLSDILGESESYFTETNDDVKYGDSLEMWLDDDIPDSIVATPPSQEFSFDALFTDESSAAFDPLEGFSYEKEFSEEETEEDNVSIDLDDDLVPFQVETEWWQHPFLIFWVVLLGTMTLFMSLLQFLNQ